MNSFKRKFLKAPIKKQKESFRKLKVKNKKSNDCS